MFLVLIGTLACFLLLAIGSYSPDDPSFTYTGGNTSIDNLVGISGAYLADILLFLFGWVAYLLPAGLIYWALKMARALAGLTDADISNQKQKNVAGRPHPISFSWSFWDDVAQAKRQGKNSF